MLLFLLGRAPPPLSLPMILTMTRKKQRAATKARPKKIRTWSQKLIRNLKRRKVRGWFITFLIVDLSSPAKKEGFASQSQSRDP